MGENPNHDPGVGAKKPEICITPPLQIPNKWDLVWGITVDGVDLQYES